MIVAGSRRGCTVAVSASVDDDVAATIEAMVAGLRGDQVGWEPERAAEVVAALDRPVRTRRGPSYLVPGGLGRPLVPVATSDDLSTRDVLAIHPESGRDLRVPFVVAREDGEATAVCETARDAGSTVEAGVWTDPAHRNRGLAGAVVRAWATMVSGRTAFYSTGDDNLASIAVARSLGLVPIGQWWIVEPV